MSLNLKVGALELEVEVAGGLDNNEEKTGALNCSILEEPYGFNLRLRRFVISSMVKQLREEDRTRKTTSRCSNQSDFQNIGWTSPLSLEAMVGRNISPI